MQVRGEKSKSERMCGSERGREKGNWRSRREEGSKRGEERIEWGRKRKEMM